ncbi:MAG TPA: aminoglycoside phosphotransferase family protein [Streptosporangiaceae bacterium]|nr:aminoglycoside phosphotransferase family protein [Streptosporangiaceae bacterium]
MLAPKLHTDELDISTELAARLIAEQAPRWAQLPVQAGTAAGTECVLYRLGDELVIRMPRRAGERLDAFLTQGILARLAPLLPVPIPELVAEGQPTADYPAYWGVLRWIAGDTPVEGRLTAPTLLAADLAKFLLALWRIDLSEVQLADAPAAYRGGPLSEEHEFTLEAIGHIRGLIDADLARSIWEHAMELPAWDGPATLIHADMMPGNIVTRNGRLAGVIDFAASGVGDPSMDLIVAWMLLPGHVRSAFREVTGVDDATWLRGRARALSMALGHLDYYRQTSAVMYDNARYTISEVFADYHRGGSV